MTPLDTASRHPDAPAGRQGSRPNPSTRVEAAPWLALTWALAYLAFAVVHLSGHGFAPWTPTDASVLGSLTAGTVSAALVVLCAAALAGLAGLWLSRPDVLERPRPSARPAHRTTLRRLGPVLLVAVGVVVALTLADARALAFLGYLPMVLLGLAGLGPAQHVDPAVLGPSLLALGQSVGGLALVATGLRALERGHVLDAGGRSLDERRRRHARALRTGRWAVAVAVLVPLFYASTRIAWALGLPFGVRDGLLDELGDGRFAGLGLALFALVGCLLTLGLVQRWGEVFWSWLPRIGGHSVPVGLAVVPASFVALAVASAGLAFLRILVTGEVTRLPGSEADWGAWAPEMFWPLWGAALAVAAVAYRTRRQDQGLALP